MAGWTFSAARCCAKSWPAGLLRLSFICLNELLSRVGAAGVSRSRLATIFAAAAAASEVSIIGASVPVPAERAGFFAAAGFLAVDPPAVADVLFNAGSPDCFFALAIFGWLLSLDLTPNHR